MTRSLGLVGAACAVSLLAGCPPNVSGSQKDVAVTKTDMNLGTVDQPLGRTDSSVDGRILIHPDSRLGGTERGIGTGDSGTSASCDPTTQNCASGLKCAFTASSAGAANMCQADGTVAAGGACMDSGTTFGVDNCVAGTLCAIWTAPPGSGTCQQYCTSDSTCASTAKCGFALTASLGLCMPSCTIGGTSCGSGNSCNLDLDLSSHASSTAPLVPILDCQPVGTTANKMPCKFNTDCVAGNACIPTGGGPDGGPTNFECLELCDTGGSTSCPTGQTCMSLVTGSTIGICF